MKYHKIISAAVSILTIAALSSASVYAANPASFSLSSSAASVVQGNSLKISVFENGDSVNVVTTKLSFDSSKFQLVSSVCGSSLPSSIPETSGVTCYASGGTSVSGNILAGTFTFKALASSGSSAVSIGSASKIVTGGVDIWNKSASSTTISFTGPVAKTQTTRRTSSKNSSRTQTATSPTTTTTSSSSSATKSKPLVATNYGSNSYNSNFRQWRAISDTIFYLYLVLSAAAIVIAVAVTWSNKRTQSKVKRFYRRNTKIYKKKIKRYFSAIKAKQKSTSR